MAAIVRSRPHVQCRAECQPWIALMRAAGGEESVIDAATRERLRALGYAGH